MGFYGNFHRSPYNTFWEKKNTKYKNYYTENKDACGAIHLISLKY
jgi:hypothetical protein